MKNAVIFTLDIRTDKPYQIAYTQIRRHRTVLNSEDTERHASNRCLHSLAPIKQVIF